MEMCHIGVNTTTRSASTCVASIAGSAQYDIDCIKDRRYKVVYPVLFGPFLTMGRLNFP